MNTIYEAQLMVVDDNTDLQKMVTEILNKEGFRDVVCCGSCEEALRCLRSRAPHLLLLDVGLPDGDGFSLMQQIRAVSNVPVLFLSARDEDSDRLLGLGLGADDYVTKPFLPRELILRLSAVLKRTYFPLAETQNSDSRLLRLGSRTVDFGSGTVTSDGQKTLTLTAKEMAILKKLWENQGNIVTFDALSMAVWQDYYYGYENTLMVHIRRLREKIEDAPSDPRYLLTVRGVGYKLRKDQ